MRIRCHALRALVAAGTIAAANGAAARDFFDFQGVTTALSPGQFFLGAGGGVARLHFPVITSWGYVGNVAGFPKIGDFSTKTSPITGFGGASIGYVLPTGALPPWAGAMPRVALGFQYWKGEASASESVGAISIARVNLNGVLPNGSSPTCVTSCEQDVRLRTEGYQIAARVASDFAMGNLVLTPSVSVVGGQGFDSYRIDGRPMLVGGAVNGPSSIDARIRTFRIGAELGLDGKYFVTQTVSLFAGARVGGAFLNARLAANDCQSFGTAIGSTCESAGNLQFFSSLAESRRTGSFRAAANVGLAAELGFGVLSFGGFFSFDSRVPSFQGASSSSGVLPAATTPARIRFTSEFAYGGGVKLTVLLPFMP